MGWISIVAASSGGDLVVVVVITGSQAPLGNPHHVQINSSVRWSPEGHRTTVDKSARKNCSVLQSIGLFNPITMRVV